MTAIWKRELQAYFLTPVGYVFMGIFLAISGIFFYMYNLMSGSASITNLLGNLSFLFMLTVPVLTMRLFSEERRNKTDQLLITSPASIASIVTGKFLAALTVLLSTLVITLFYILVFVVYSKPSAGEVISSYIGSFLMGACYVSIGILMSTITENQVTAAFATFGINLLLQLLEAVGPSLNVPFFPFLPTVLSWVSLQQRLYSFLIGLFSFANVLYYASFCVLVLFFAMRVIDKRRWSEG